MKLLYVLPEWILPLDRGHHTLASCLLRGLSREVECSVIGLNFPLSASSLPPELAKVRVLGSFPTSTGALFWLRRLGNVALLKPPSLARDHSRALSEALSRLAGNFDVIHYHVFNMAQYARPEVPSVLTAPDAYSMAYWRLAHRGPLPHPSHALRAITIQRFETARYPRLTRVVVVSKLDQEYLQKQVPSARIDYIPLPVPEEFFDLVAPLPPRPTILMSGHFQAPGVADGLLWYVRNVHPLVLKKVPDACLQVIGSDIGEKLRQELGQHPGVRVDGYVPDYIRAVAQARVLVCCETVGSGARNRVIQALALGKAVVGATASFGGVEVRDGAEALVRDGAEPFAEAVINVLKDDRLASELGARAREYAWQNHHPEKVAHRMLGVYEAAVRDFKRT